MYCCASHYDFVFSYPSSMGSWASLPHFTTFANNLSERSERFVLYYSHKSEALLSNWLNFNLHVSSVDMWKQVSGWCIFFKNTLHFRTNLQTVLNIFKESDLHHSLLNPKCIKIYELLCLNI